MSRISGGSLPPDPLEEAESLPAQPFPAKEYLLYVAGALRRRMVVAGLTFLATMIASYAIYKKLPRTYHVETRLLAQKQQALPALARTSGTDEPPTRSAFELVHKRDNLLSIIRQTGLFVPSKPDPQPSLRARLGLPPLGLIGAPPTEEDRLNTLVSRLADGLIVQAGDGVLTLGIEWDDPQQAYRLVEAIVQNFLEERQVQEITSLDEVISIVEGNAAKQRRELDQEEARERNLLASGREPQPAPTGARPSSRPKLQSEEEAQLRSMLEAKKRAIHDIEEFRRRRLAELQAQLDEKRGVYSEAYPSLVNLRQDIEAVSQESPQVASLKDEVAELERQIAQRFGATEAAAGESAAATATPRPDRRQLTRDSPEVIEQSERVRDARYKYEKTLDHITAARLDRDTARAAFKYRYAIIWPALVPKGAIKPKRPVVLGIGFVAAVLLSAGLATLLEWRRGKIVQRWQIERILGLPVLAELP
jgi:uncharacterized protein involved in exopolysaccharide biosynthesis